MKICKAAKVIYVHFVENVVRKLTPECGYIRSAVNLVPTEKKENCGTKQRWSKGRTEEERLEDLLPELTPTHGSQIR